MENPKDIFKKGDVVVLNSGGPIMTVRSIGKTSALCIWFDKDHILGEKIFNLGIIRSSVRGDKIGYNVMREG